MIGNATRLKNINKDSKHTSNNTNNNDRIEIALAQQQQQQQQQQSSNNNSRDLKMYAFCSSVRVSLFWLNLARWEIVFFFFKMAQNYYVFFFGFLVAKIIDFLKF
jgi:hypothetical protein